MKKLFITCTLIIFVFINNAFSQVVIQRPQQQQQNQQQGNQQQVSYQQVQQQPLTPEQQQQMQKMVEQKMFDDYASAFYPEATSDWIKKHSVLDTLTKEVKGYKIMYPTTNGAPIVNDFIIPRGAVVARYKDSGSDDYYFVVSTRTFIVKDKRYEVAKKKAEQQKKEQEKAAKKLARENRTPEEKAMIMQRDIMIGQMGYNMFLQIFDRIQTAKIMKRQYELTRDYNNAVYDSYSNGGVQTVSWGLGGN